MAREASVLDQFLKAQDDLVLQASDLSLRTVSDMVAADAIDVSPEFQRRERWDARKQSALIESFLLNIPIPPIYLAEEQFGRYSVIDGKQRITSINEFLSDRLTLRGLTRMTRLEGSRFSDLPDELRNALTVRPYLRAVTLLKQSDSDVKYEVFHRLNVGGQPLNAQEIRNVVYRGATNDMIIRLSGDSFLRQQLKIVNERSGPYKEMADVEYVLRFLALAELGDTFKGDFRVALDAFMRRHKNPSSGELSAFEDRFARSLHWCRRIFGDHAFRRYEPRSNSWRDQFLGGMYDAQMLAVNALRDDELAELESPAINARTRGLGVVMSLLAGDDEFVAAVTAGTNTPARLKYRVERVTEALRAA